MANFCFLVSCLWLWLVVSRLAHASSEDESSCGLPGGGGIQCVILVWKKGSHLRPNYYRGRALVPIHFWLLLLAGDVEVNPGHVRYPCTMCKKAVKSNQRGILCDRCELWSHARCCAVDASQYERLGQNENEEWLCPSCISAELPFADVSLPTNNSTTWAPNGTPPDPLEKPSPLDDCTSKAVFCHLNVRSLLNKMDELRSVLQCAKRPVVFGISETWLNSSVLDNEVVIPTYDLYRRDRNSNGGGVLVYVAMGFRSRRRLDLEEDRLEIIWVELHVNRRTLLLGNMYRPPNADVTVVDGLGAMLERIASECKDMILMGDLNFNLLNPPNQAESFLLSARDNNLEQLICEPTRITDHSQTLLDVLFTSNPDLFLLFSGNNRAHWE